MDEENITSDLINKYNKFLTQYGHLSLIGMKEFGLIDLDKLYIRCGQKNSKKINCSINDEGLIIFTYEGASNLHYAQFKVFNTATNYVKAVLLGEGLIDNPNKALHPFDYMYYDGMQLILIRKMFEKQFIRNIVTKLTSIDAIHRVLLNYKKNNGQAVCIFRCLTDIPVNHKKLQENKLLKNKYITLEYEEKHEIIAQ